MKVLIINKLKMQWEPVYVERFEKQGYQEVTVTRSVGDPSTAYVEPSDIDLRLFMWADENAVKLLNHIKANNLPGKNIVFVRRYEFFSGAIEAIPWDVVSKIVVVNPKIGEWMERRTGIKPVCIYNGVDPEKWTFKKMPDLNESTYRNKDLCKNIAVVGFICKKKNYPLALQILVALKRQGYHMHFAGAMQDMATMLYMENLIEGMGLKDDVTFHGQVENMDKWLDDKDFLLSTAVSEGCPNNVLEAMAKGIQPIIHNWPGAEEIFNRDGHWLTFNSVAAAVQDIREHRCERQYYRNFIESEFGLGQFQKVVDLCGEVLNG